VWNKNFLVAYLVESGTGYHLDKSKIFPESEICSVGVSLWVQNLQDLAVQITMKKKS